MGDRGPLSSQREVGQGITRPPRGRPLEAPDVRKVQPSGGGSGCALAWTRSPAGRTGRGRDWRPRGRARSRVGAGDTCDVPATSRGEKEGLFKIFVRQGQAPRATQEGANGLNERDGRRSGDSRQGWRVRVVVARESRKLPDDVQVGHQDGFERLGKYRRNVNLRNRGPVAVNSDLQVGGDRGCSLPDPANVRILSIAVDPAGNPGGARPRGRKPVRDDVVRLSGKEGDEHQHAGQRPNDRRMVARFRSVGWLTEHPLVSAGNNIPHYIISRAT